ncbi:MAG: hypothetical protein M0Z37_06795 [Nitrospiraceae bacterium]|nr:hypothetical protein [Nitrospiraceae bacterium]
MVWWENKKGGNSPLFGLQITRCCGVSSCGDVGHDDGALHNGDALDSNDDGGDSTCCDGYSHDGHVAFSCAFWHVLQELLVLLVRLLLVLLARLHLRQKKLALR